jgi:hypothetical protein
MKCLEYKTRKQEPCRVHKFESHFLNDHQWHEVPSVTAVKAAPKTLVYTNTVHVAP